MDILAMERLEASLLGAAARRLTTNTWDHIAKVRPSVTVAFLVGVSVPCSGAADAVEESESEIIPWLESDGTVPAQHLVAGLVISSAHQQQS